MKLGLRFAHLAFHEIDNFFRLGHRVVFGHCSDDHVRAVEKNHRWRDPLGLRVGNDLGFSVSINVGNRGKSRAQIDSDYFAFTHG